MRYKLSDLFELQMGKTPSRNNPNYWDSNDYSWVSISDMSSYDKYVSGTKEYISEQAVKESGIKTIPANTVIMSFKLSIGKTAITTGPIFSNEAIMAFIDKKTTTIDPEYIFYLFSGKNWDEGSNKAVMGKTLNKATLSNIEVDIPSLDIQKERIEKLNKISILIADKKQQLNQLDELIKARFVEMFGDRNYDIKPFKDVCDELFAGGDVKKDRTVKVADANHPY
ncbi:restriction endonuclease subunit S, partial [Candidatus Saccharibacteria bacterium]|nr:restriction endonuclease subunit S [Candidatus Saccharibacteria bacterium]